MKPVQAQPGLADRAIPHSGHSKGLAWSPRGRCLPRRDRRTASRGALRALRVDAQSKGHRGAHQEAVHGYTFPRSARRDILATLVRLHHREADYDGSWWGIRPDTTGPYFDPREWESSGRIASVLKTAVIDGDAETARFLRGELARRRVRLEGLPADATTDRPKAEEEIRVLLAKADPNNPNQIGNMSYDAAG